MSSSDDDYEVGYDYDDYYEQHSYYRQSKPSRNNANHNFLFLQQLKKLRLEELNDLFSDLAVTTTTTAISETASTSKASESNASSPECSKAKEPSEVDPKLPSSEETFQIPKPVKVERNDDIVIGLLDAFSENTDEFTEIIKNGNVYKLKELPSDEYDYRRTEETFKSSMRCAKKQICRLYSVDAIKKVCCPYLVAHFRIRKEKKTRLESFVFEQEVYHGTKNANVASICKANFNWRKCGTEVGTKFGRGVSFAKYPTYATFYPKTVFEYPRVMLVTKILYVRKQIGRTGMSVPDDNYDTTTNAKEEVIVKYDDAEFVPLFVIYYSL